MTSNTSRKFFLLSPENFKIEYSINQWMNPANQVNPERAMQQWQTLWETYEELGVDLTRVDLEEPKPDHTFLGDSIFLYGDKAVASHFRHPERAAEVEPVLENFTSLGFNIHRLPEGVYFEGNGDTVKWNDLLLAGYGQRSDMAAHHSLIEILSAEVLSLEVQKPHFHIDTCICPLDSETLAYVDGSLSEKSMNALKELDANLIEISPEEGLLLAGNCISVDKNVVLSNQQIPGFIAALKEAGFIPIPLDLSEFAKSGGGAKCLTLEAYPAD